MGDLISSLPMQDLPITGNLLSSFVARVLGPIANHFKTRNLNDITPNNWERAISVMSTSCFYAIKYGSQAMVVTSKEKPQPSGNIILTSSCAAFLGAYADISYSTQIPQPHLGPL